MGRHQDLRSFLRKEVKKGRVRPPCEPKLFDPESKGPTGALSVEDSSSIILDTDSLFGDPIISQEAKAEKRLQDFLSQPCTPHLSHPTCSPYSPASATLQSLKEELQNTIHCIEIANPREQELIRRQRSSLVDEIQRLEGIMGAKKKKERKELCEKQLKTLPEPIGRSERKRIVAKKAKAAKVKKHEEVHRSKKGERMDEFEDLDGEERYRLGVTKKRRATKPTGHWKSNIHGYLPGFGDEKEVGEDGRILSLSQVSCEDRILLRRDLMELAKKFAKDDRKKQRKALQKSKD